MKKLIIILLVVATAISVHARIKKSDDVSASKILTESSSSVQKKSTFVSVSYGISNYLGDLGGNEGVGKKFLYDNNLKKRTSFIGVSLSHIRNEAWGLRLSYTSGKIAGSDDDVVFKNKADAAYYRFKRNLDFRSTIKEWALLAEVYPFKFLNKKTRLYTTLVQPYCLLGLGRYSFNPQGTYFDEISGDDVWIDLAPLRTEGQGMKEYPDRRPYKLKQTNMPYGLGVKYNLGFKTSVGIEFVGRKLFTDYLDDVSTSYIDPTYFGAYLNEEDFEIAKAINNKSNLIEPTNPYKAGEQRGNSKKNDYYYSLNVKLSIQINKRKGKPFETYEAPQKNYQKWKHYKYDNSEICD